jgi:hypothetical protein
MIVYTVMYVIAHFIWVIGMMLMAKEILEREN